MEAKWQVVLWADVLRTGDIGVIDAASRHAWAEFSAQLRAYVARRVSSPSDVDDLVQSIFLRVQGGLAELRDDERFGSWVYQVARNAIADHYKRASRHHLVRADDAEEPTAAAPEQENAESLLAAYVARFVAMLPVPYREALTLTELQGLSHKQTAEMLGISVSGVKSRVQRGRQQLRELFMECCEIALDVRGGVVSCEPRPNNALYECECKKPL